MNENQPVDNVDSYMQQFPGEVQRYLAEMRRTILHKAPEAIESISYGMPAYKLFGKVLVYFAAYKNHIGFYATPNGHAAFQKELAHYKQGKGSVQFPLNQPLPVELISKMVQFRVDEQSARNLKKKL